MPPVQRFRSAFNGFNRSDVVQYIEYLNNHYETKIQQLTNQLQNATASAEGRELEDLRAKCAKLEAQLAQQIPSDNAELESYRRAEKAERLANERAQRIYEKTNAALAEACAKAEEAANQVSAAAEQATAQFKVYEQSVLDAKATFRETVDSLYAIRPEEE